MTTPLDRVVTERLHGLSLRGTANIEGNTSRKFLSMALKNPYDEVENPTGCINLGYAENTLMRDEIVEFANSKPIFSHKLLLYGDGYSGSNALRKALARFLNENFSPLKPVEPSHILVTNGCTSLVDQFAWSVAEPGEGILIGRPLYQGFISDFTIRSRARPVIVSCAGVDPFGPEVVAKYEEALLKSEAAGVKIRALLLCHPNNPLGKCYALETLKGLMALCQKYQIHLLSDELYAMSKFETDDSSQAHSFVSLLSIPHEGLIDPSLLHVAYGMSKDFSANGMRLAAFISQYNENFFKAIGTLGLFAWPSSPGQELWLRMLEDKEWLSWYLKENSRRLGVWYKYTLEWLKERNIEYVKGGNHGFFVWCNLRFALPQGDFESDLERERALIARMLEEGVYAATGETFHAEEYGWFRLTFTTQLLEKGLERLDKVLYGAPRKSTLKSPLETTSASLNTVEVPDVQAKAITVEV